MVATRQTYTEFALTAAGRRWELHRGVPREKPAMSFGHNETQRRLGRSSTLQLDPTKFDLSIDASRVRRGDETVYIPDLFVFPVEFKEEFRDRLRALEVYTRPIPLVIEIWSPSTGDDDIETKLPEYRARGDLDIWRLQPFDQTLTTWRKQPDGSYAIGEYRGGTIEPVALPGVVIDLDALFAP